MSAEKDTEYSKVEFLSIMKSEAKVLLLCLLTVGLYQFMTLIPILNVPLNMLLTLILTMTLNSTIARIITPVLQKILPSAMVQKLILTSINLETGSTNNTMASKNGCVIKVQVPAGGGDVPLLLYNKVVSSQLPTILTKVALF